MHADAAGAVPSSPLTAAHTSNQARFFFTPKFFFISLAALFAAHVLERLWITPLAFIDEGWQLVLAQHWSLGYVAHPPLYTWLQIIFFKVFGESIFTLALLKNALLFGLYSFTYLSARLLTRRHADGVFATMCLLLIPQIGWECQRDLTHSVLLGATTAATLFAFFALAEKPTAWRYALLGTSVASALLSKYNSALFIAAFATAALIVPRYRAVLLDRRMLITLFTCGALITPHFVWAFQHRELVMAAARKLDATYFATWTAAARLLPWLMVKAFVPNMLPVILMYAFAKPPAVMRLRSDAARMLFWSMVFALAALGIGMFIAKAGGLRGRWFMPLFVCAPILLVAQLGAVPRRLHRLALTLGIIVIVAVLAVLPLNAHRQGAKKKELTAATITEVTVWGGALTNADLVLAETLWIGGNVRLRTGKPVMAPFATWPIADEPKHIGLVFNANHGPEPSLATREFVSELLKRPVTLQVVYLSSTNDHAGMRLGVAVVD